MLEQGPRERAVIQAALKRGQPLPEVIQNAPEMDPELMFIWEAFWDLSHDRSLGFGAIGYIPWSVMDRYAHRNGIDDPECFGYLVAMIKGIDETYVEHVNRKPDGRTGRVRSEDPPHRGPDPGEG